MDFLSKVRTVKENIERWQKEWGDNFLYLVSDFETENEETGIVRVHMSKEEHRDILKYLASTGYIEIVEEEKPNSAHIKVLPKKKPTIRLKTLELIAIDIGQLDTGRSLVDFLIDCGTDKRLIVYPQTKWRMIYAVLVELASSKNAKDKEVLFKVIGNTLHPLMHGGNKFSAEMLQSTFMDYLSYDNFVLFYDKKEGVYKITEPLSEGERKEIIAELNKKEKREFEFLCKSENKEKISLLRKTYQVLMGVVEVFCRNFPRLSHEETVDLNKHYLTLDKAVWGIVDKLQLGEPFKGYRKYPRPFTNLFSAEKELDGDISWDVIRREMSARFGEIETLYQKVNASDILAEPDKQKQLNDITLYLSELKEKTKETKMDEETIEPPTTRIEITKLPPLQFSDTSEDKLLNKIKPAPPVIIKDARLDEKNYLLEINSGGKIISFKSKKKGEGLEKETKQFKILCHLWEFRWELKDGRVLKKGDYASLDNLAREGGSESTGAAYKQIQRLNSRFIDEEVAIEIKGENEKYRLIINKA